MTKLTLPIQIGRRYVRRDGAVVTTGYGNTSFTATVNTDTEPYCAVWKSTGRWYQRADIEAMMDLVADAPGERAEAPVGHSQTERGPDKEKYPIKTAPTGHPHAELMAQYAEDARTHERPWLLWESANKDVGWSTCPCNPSWQVDRQYRRKPRTIIINGHEVPDPLREIPPPGSAVYWPDIADGEHVAKHALVGSMLDWPCLTRLRSRGLLHLTRDAAEQHARALLSFTMEGEA